MVKRLKRAVSNGDPTNDWKRLAIAVLTFSTLVVGLLNNSKISVVQTEARTAAVAATQAVETVTTREEIRDACQPCISPTPQRKNQ